MITIAVPKGRVLKSVSKVFSQAGVDTSVLLAEDRTLIRTCPQSGYRFLLLKPDDVPTYVEYGVADLGVVGRDVLLERAYDLLVPRDLGIGRCRLVVAATDPDALAKRVSEHGGWPGVLRVATKFPRVTQTYFRGRGMQVETVYVQGSVELAPITGLADVIVDLVESGETLRQNGLVEVETIGEVSTLLVANRASYKRKYDHVQKLMKALAA